MGCHKMTIAYHNVRNKFLLQVNGILLTGGGVDLNSHPSLMRTVRHVLAYEPSIAVLAICLGSFIFTIIVKHLRSMEREVIIVLIIFLASEKAL
jgi:hypothetical protein